MTTVPKKIEQKNGVTGRQNLLKTFTIDYTSYDGIRYTGRFTTKKLSISDIAALGVRKTQLNGGYHFDPSTPGHGIDSQTDDFNAMLAHLDLALKETPQWWKLDEITDAELIGKVFQEVVAHENSFLRRRRQADSSDGTGGSDTSGSGEVSGGSDSQETNGNGATGSLVVEEVQAALEP